MSSPAADFPTTLGLAEVTTVRASWRRGYLVSLFFALILFYHYSPGSSLRRSLDPSARALQSDEVEEVGAGSAQQIIAAALLAALAALAVAQNGLSTSARTSIVAVTGPLFLAYASASSFWADDLTISLKRDTALVLLAGLAFILSRVWTWSQLNLFMVLMLALLGGTAVLVDIGTGVFHPFSTAYRLSGLHHPNVHGRDSALLMVASVAGMYTIPKAKRLMVFTMGLSLVLLLLTRSRTALGSGLIAAGIVALMLWPRRRLALMLMVPLALALAAFLIIPNLGQDVSHALLMGRDAGEADVTTLTGRTYLWQVLLGYAHDRPLLGYGYGGFWTPDRVLEVAARINWYVSHAHSGYIDSILSFGYVGLPIYLTVLVTGIGVAAYKFVQTRDPVFALGLGVVVWFAINSAAESPNPRSNLCGFFCMAVMARLARPMDGTELADPHAA